MSTDRKQQQQLQQQQQQQQQQPIHKYQWCSLKALYTKLPSAFNMHVYSVCSKNENFFLALNIEYSGKYGIATENKSSLRNEYHRHTENELHLLAHHTRHITVDQQEVMLACGIYQLQLLNSGC